LLRPGEVNTPRGGRVNTTPGGEVNSPRHGRGPDSIGMNSPAARVLGCSVDLRSTFGGLRPPLQCGVAAAIVGRDLASGCRADLEVSMCRPQGRRYGGLHPRADLKVSATFSLRHGQPMRWHSHSWLCGRKDTGRSACGTAWKCRGASRSAPVAGVVLMTQKDGGSISYLRNMGPGDAYDKFEQARKNGSLQSRTTRSWDQVRTRFELNRDTS